MRWKMVPEQYTVIWVCGECGISLRNFSRNENKVGAQIAVLQHADGVTTGISNCRLGDQLITINTERVDALRFSQIIDMLKTTRRPISLGFRTNANMQTSPRNAPSSSTKVQNTTGESRSNHFFSRGGPVESKTIKKTLSLPVADRCLMSGDNYTNGSKSCDGDESSEVVRRTLDHSGYGDLKSKFRSSSGEATAFDRSTITSVQSSSWTLSDDLEIWCREQEEMHSDIILLLTETVMRCERLQQENLDQLQNLMQLSASSPHQRDRSGTTSSYADTEKVRNVEVD
ncbi:unnamed protein product [Peronospora belbahrii]|uniref:PDZ domain-containing protein n=1 Tax=Peronospora belbahrii TaxID=622444 RepID=A0AAU9L017_9STRA|nr:unnamed protein product [Peronospora belbahrii]